MIKYTINLIKKNTEFILYAIFGVLNIFVSFFVFHICNSIFGEQYYLLNNIIAWFCTVTVSCFNNKFFVFKSRSLKPEIVIREVIIFYLSRVMTLALEELGLWLLVDILSFSQISFNIFSFEITGHLIAKGIVGIISVIVNYIFTKFITFSKKQKTQKNSSEAQKQ